MNDDHRVYSVMAEIASMLILMLAAVGIALNLLDISPEYVRLLGITVISAAPFIILSTLALLKMLQRSFRDALIFITIIILLILNILL